MKNRVKRVINSAVIAAVTMSVMAMVFTGCAEKAANESAAVHSSSAATTADVTTAAVSTSTEARTETAAATATYTDLAGRKVSITTNVQRIVLLRSRDIYELSAILGEEISEKLVGWGPDLKNKDNDGYKKFLEVFPKLNSITDTGDVQSDAVSVETVVNLSPDLVVADQYMLKEFQCVQKLIDAGLPVVCIDESTDPLATPQKGIRLLGKILGKESRADQIANYADEQVKKIYNTVATLSGPKPRVYLECGDTGPKTFSSAYAGADDQSWGTVMSKLRITNIADGSIQETGQINPELVISSNPDIIVITGQHWTSATDSMRLGFYADEADSRARLQAYTTRTGWNNLSAVKNDRVYSVFHNLSMHIFDFVGLQALAKDFYPDAFENIDPEQNLKTFFDQYMPISYSGFYSIGLTK